MDQLASADMIARKIGLNPMQIPGYTNARLQIAPLLAQIMVQQNRYPTREEFLSAAQQGIQAFQNYNLSNWQLDTGR